MRHFIDLNYNEMMEVVNNNKDLKEALTKTGYDLAIGEDGDVWLMMDDYLYNFPKNGTYRISGYYDELRLGNDYQDIIRYIRGIQHDFCFLYKNDDPEYYDRLIDKLERYTEVLEDCDYYGCINIKTKDYNFMVDFCENAIEELEADLLRNFQAQYEYYYNDDNCLEFAVERICDGLSLYIDDLGCDIEDIIITDDLKTIFDYYDMV